MRTHIQNAPKIPGRGSWEDMTSEQSLKRKKYMAPSTLAEANGSKIVFAEIGHPVG